MAVEFPVNCESCPAFVLLDEKTGGGCCHGNPPTPFLMVMGKDALGQPVTGTRGYWPPVGKTDWCMRHPLFNLKSDVVPIDKRLAADAEGNG